MKTKKMTNYTRSIGNDGSEATASPCAGLPKGTHVRTIALICLVLSLAACGEKTSISRLSRRRGDSQARFSCRRSR